MFVIIPSICQSANVQIKLQHEKIVTNADAV